jgi:hypothetical protein
MPFHWTAPQTLMTVVILSPHSSGTLWPEDTARSLRFLKGQHAIAAAFVCKNENYLDHAPVNYPNVVGDDHVPYTALGNCELLKQQILPNLR